ncbi:hypothetical protein [Acetobacter fabarum]|uniref:hypothetical protein n=1 Tax=Acetobacter fabarum TaxID=483199 RepID=UPI001C5277B1|nr:hypothetical protein [Acetobacter fabarum]
MPEFVYAGSSDPASELADSTDGHTSDHWKADGENAHLMRQEGSSFIKVDTVHMPSIVSDVLIDIGKRFSVYHTDALNTLCDNVRKYSQED